MAEQSFERHAKIVFGYHRVAFLALVIYVIWAMGRLFRDPGFETVAFACLGLAVALFGLYARLFATRNQDRLIRLEERMRLRALLPADLHSEIESFTTRQLVALRFASDDELPELARRVLKENILESKRIKSMIKTWRADHERV